MPPPRASYHPDMSTVAEPALASGRAFGLVVRGGAVLAAALAVGQTVVADAAPAARVLAIVALTLAGAMLWRSWRPLAHDRRALWLQVAGLGALLAAAGALAPAPLAAGLTVVAGLRLGRDVGGYEAMGALAAVAGAQAVGLALHGGGTAAPAAAGLFLGLFLFGMAEPERGAWCACELRHKTLIRNLDALNARRDGRPGRRS